MSCYSGSEQISNAENVRAWNDRKWDIQGNHRKFEEFFFPGRKKKGLPYQSQCNLLCPFVALACQHGSKSPTRRMRNLTLSLLRLSKISKAVVKGFDECTECLPKHVFLMCCMVPPFAARTCIAEPNRHLGECENLHWQYRWDIQGNPNEVWETSPSSAKKKGLPYRAWCAVTPS